MRQKLQHGENACVAHPAHVHRAAPPARSPAAQVHSAAPARVDVLLLLGAVHYQLRHYEQCVAFNDRAILLDPGLAEAHANLANALQQLGNMDMAIVYYQVKEGGCLGTGMLPGGGGRSCVARGEDGCRGKGGTDCGASKRALAAASPAAGRDIVPQRSCAAKHPAAA